MPLFNPCVYDSLYCCTRTLLWNRIHSLLTCFGMRPFLPGSFSLFLAFSSLIIYLVGVCIYFSLFSFFGGRGGVISVGYCCWYCRTALALLFDLLYCLGNSSASGKIYLPNSWCFCFLQSIDMTILPSKLGCDLCNLIHSRGCFLETLELTGIDCLLIEFFFLKKKKQGEWWSTYLFSFVHHNSN